MNYCYTLNYEKYLHIQTCIKQTNISGYYKFIFWNLFYENVNVVSRSRILMVILCLYLWWILIVDVNGWICTVFYVQYCVLCKEMLNEQSLLIFYYYLPCINYLLFDIFCYEIHSDGIVLCSIKPSNLYPILYSFHFNTSYHFLVWLFSCTKYYFFCLISILSNMLIDFLSKVFFAAMPIFQMRIF